MQNNMPNEPDRSKIKSALLYWRGKPVVILEIREGPIFVDRIDGTGHDTGLHAPISPLRR